MVFNSFAFLVFFPIVLLLHFISPRKIKWVMLLAASYYFYVSWSFKLIWLILFTTAVSYAAALLISKTSRLWLKKVALVLALLSCLGVLFFFKYFDFLSLSTTRFLRLFIDSVPDCTLGLILPVGISFYTFQTLSYVIDVYRGNMAAERHFGYYALYVSFFPQLVAGPIERPDSLIPQLKKPHKFTMENLAVGGRIMLSGYVKKIVVADTIAVYINSVYNNAHQATGLSVLIATLLFAVQIYCDFSGYTDIAIGCARIMDIRLMKNFDHPYRAKSIKEFWSRWHISLSSWLKDYLYIPLGGNRCSVPRHIFNLFVVFLVSGIWHGADWTFVLWGVLHGIYQIIGHMTIHKRNRLVERMGLQVSSGIVPVVRQFNAFLLVCFAWLIFRANSISDAGVLAAKLFTDWQFSFAYLENSFGSLNCTTLQLVICALCAVLVTVCDKVYTDCEEYPVQAESGTVLSFVSKHKTTILTIWLIAVSWFLLLSQNGASSFIYFQF